MGNTNINPYKSKYDIKKLKDLELLHKNMHKNNHIHRFMTTSIDDREGDKNRFHFDVGLKIFNNKNSTLLPTKNLTDTNQTMKDLERIQAPENINNSSLIASKANQNPTKSFELNNGLLEIINNLNRTNENKSRNQQRNNLTNVRSSMYSSYKGQSIHSGSYQIVKQNIKPKNINLTVNNRMEALPQSKTATNASINIKNKSVMNRGKIRFIP